MTHAALTDTDLHARFQPIFDRIAEGAAQRDHDRHLAYEPVQWLRESGFTALRVPQALGGLGASIEQLFDLLIALGEADANLPQILRAHFGFVERLSGELRVGDPAPWLRRVAEGDIFGNATSEAKNTQIGRFDTTVRRDGEGWRLNGEKFYSTGSLYANWVQVAVRVEGEEKSTRQTVAIIPADRAGVALIDDWFGFGQRLSASGTSRFDNVWVEDERIFSYERGAPTSMTTLFQLFHLATLAGIARAIERDAVAFVKPRQRVYSHSAGNTPADDPLVQQVVGKLSAAAFVATAAVQSVARALGDVERARQSDGAAPLDLLTRVELLTARAQVGVVDVVIDAASRLFDVGGASALLEERRFDRHWRNARTLASHNPTIYKAKLLGEHAINGTPPSFYWSVGPKVAA